MKRAFTILGLGATTVLTSASSATVTGLSVQYMGVVSGRDIYSVFVNSNGPGSFGEHDVILNMIGHQVIGGSMANVQHTDSFLNDYDEAIGHWNASYTSASTAATSNQYKDSYVTITGKTGAQSSTSLDPWFGSGVNDPANPAIPPAAGWYTANPAVDILIQGGKIKVMQIAVAATPGHAYQYTGKMSVGYKLQGTTTPLYAMNMTYVIGTPVPAPGALALLGFVGLGSRRRRACGGSN